ncbi:2-haloacid dehalogenase [Arthrobacter sp. CAN_A212]|uniref:haloacid dehalogenase type II n=1 Tax=unclassified Arthrobacter TaxID=235627 RepID=UPI001A1FCBE2|nr:haloacid dehalogenase type II [Arthrobacter sp. CAN_C5]MBP2216858.1 2-haloacid dehalogenase [Arthrobacter sp. CAN_C5]
MSTNPSALIFDVNETLSDLAPLQSTFIDAGLASDLPRPWFAELLRDGFALTASGSNPLFADLASDSFHRLLMQNLGPADYREHIDHLLTAFRNLPLHADVAPGVEALSAITQLVTLSNGAAAVAESLLTRGGIRDRFSRLLSVQDAQLWKPARPAYEYAAQETGHAPEDLMLVAVHPWDIHGANAAGVQTAWINRSAAAYPSYFSPPDVVARDLVDLAKILQEG